MKRTFWINSPEVRSGAAKAIMNIRGEDNLDVIIQPHKDDKTIAQRNWFHTLCGILGNEAGYTKAEVKELVKQEILGTTVVTIGGTEREVTASSEAEDKIGYLVLIDGLYRIAAEAGFQLPNPEWRE